MLITPIMRKYSNYKLLVLFLLCTFAQGAWAQTHVATESELKDAISSGNTIVLDNDIQLESRVSVNVETLTLDLNGHTLSRNLSGSSSTGQVISVSEGCNFTLMNGTVTGGKGYEGGGVYNEGTTTVKNCVIKDNYTDGGGGGLSNYPGATMTVVDSEILNNSADNTGGGIDNYGNLTVTNCKISGNTTGGGQGCGIYNRQGSLTLGGEVEITGNRKTGSGWGGGINTFTNINIQGKIIIRENSVNEPGLSGSTRQNVVFHGDSKFILKGALKDGSNIGAMFYYQNQNTVITSGYTTYNERYSPDTYFFSDLSNHAFVKNSSDEAELVEGGVNYYERACDKTNQKVIRAEKSVHEYYSLNPNDTILEEGVYVVSGTVTFNNRIHVDGDVKFVLLKDAVVNANKGIHIVWGVTFSVHDGPEGSGTLNATGEGYDAGIGAYFNRDQGPGFRSSGGLFALHGGTVNATAEYGAGIGCEYDGYDHSEGSEEPDGPEMLVITIYDGDVKATSTKGCAIGGEGADNQSLPDINFYGGTVSAQGATKAMNNYYIYKEKLTIAPYMMASTGDDPNSLTGRSVQDRIDACRTDKCALIKPCNHEHLLYTPAGEVHTINCTTCSVYTSSEAHSFSAETHLCTLCGYCDPQYRVDVVCYIPLSDGSGYTTETQSVPENSSYKLPTCGVAIAGMEFVGWQQVSSGDDLPEIMSSVISGNVLYVGTQFTVTEKLYFVPRYRKDGPYAVYNTINSTLRFYNDEYFLDNISESTTSYGLNDDGISPGWISDSYRNNITNVLFTSSFKTTRPTSMNNWFALPNLRSIDGLEYLNTSEVTNMDSLFYSNYSLPYIDISSFDMGKVSKREQMFWVWGSKKGGTILIYLPKGTTESDFPGNLSGQFKQSYNIVETTDGVNYTCKHYRIFDGCNVSVPKPFTATQATFERTFTNGRRSTVFLPFAFDTRTFGKIYSFSGELMAENAGVCFDLMPVGTTVANTPYIIDPKGTTITATNVEVMATQATTITESNNQLVGVYTNGYVPLDAYCYDADNGKLKRVEAENSVNINAGQAYFLMPDAAGVNEIDVVFEVETVATGIAETVGDEGQNAGDCYTLDGRKLSGLPVSKGIYIHNGRKFVVK